MTDKYEKVLTGFMTVARFCQLSDTDRADLVLGFQNAHDKIAIREANQQLFGLLRGMKSGKFTRQQMQNVFRSGSLDQFEKLFGEPTAG